MLEIFNSFKEIYYLILAIIGVPINLLAIVILTRGKCGLSTCTTYYLVAMAAADLSVIISEVIMWRVRYYYFPRSFMDITHVCRLITFLRRAATDCSVWFTVTFSFDRFVVICCQKLKINYCTQKTAAIILATTGILLCLKNVPHYFTQGPVEIINRVPWGCTLRPNYFTDPAWLGFDWFDTVLTPFLPFASILLFNIWTVKHILVSSRVRKGLKAQSRGQNHSDPEMESRRKSIILLLTISGSFILLWMVYVIHFFYYSMTGANVAEYTAALYIFSQVGFMLLNLNCCTNTFIYGVTQSTFREQVKKFLKCPIICRLMNKQNI